MVRLGYVLMVRLGYVLMVRLGYVLMVRLGGFKPSMDVWHICVYTVDTISEDEVQGAPAP